MIDGANMVPQCVKAERLRGSSDCSLFTGAYTVESEVR